MKPLDFDITQAPGALHSLLAGAKLYDNSGHSGAQTLFVDRGGGYFLKIAAAGKLTREAEMTRYFHRKGMAAKVAAYHTGERDWLLTEKMPGEDCTAAHYLAEPARLCDILAETLAWLHSMDCGDCPLHTPWYLESVRHNYQTGDYDKSQFPDNFGYASAEEAWGVIETRGHLLESNTLLHGDFCLPNVMLRNWAFSGLIDVNGGAGDRHVDLFWALWSLGYNTGTDQYRQRFIDAYGREKVDEERLRVVAAAEVFG